MDKEQNTSPFQFVNDNENKTYEDIINVNDNVTNTESEEAFVAGLPDWDLLPPYETIKRVIRK